MPTRIDQTTSSPIGPQQADERGPTDDRARHAEQVERIHDRFAADQLQGAAAPSILDQGSTRAPTLTPGRADVLRHHQIDGARTTAALDVTQLRNNAITALISKFDAAPERFHAGMARIYGSGYDAATTASRLARCRPLRRRPSPAARDH